MDINITVRNKIAILVNPIIAVCGNSDYVVKFDFDSEWDAFENKTARFKYNGEYIDIIFTGNECNMPVIKNAYRVEIGVYAGDLHTTTSAFLIMKKSVTSDNGAPAAPAPDVYDQLMQRMNEIEAPEAVLYTEQILTDEQKAQARANINADRFEVEIYRDRGTPYSDKTAKQIYDAFASGKTVEIAVDLVRAMLTECRMQNDKYYISCYVPRVTEAYTVAGLGSYMLYLDGVLGTVRGMWKEGLYNVTAAAELAPITGIVTADKLTSPDHPTDLVNYEAFQAAVPRVQQMNISGATVGQTIKVKTVDANGCPTSWEAADMASGSSGEVWETLTFDIPENDPVSAATINLPSANIIKACIQISLFGTIENTKFSVMVFTGGTTGATFLSAEINNFYTNAQQIRTGAIVLEKKADFWQSIYNTYAIAGNRNITGALRFISYNSDYLYIKTSTANETFYGTVTMDYVVGGSI